MESVKRCCEPIFVHMGINFRGGDAGVTEKFLDNAKIGSAREQVGGKRVAEEMRIDAAIKASGLGGSFDDSPKVGGGDPASVIPQENFSA